MFCNLTVLDQIETISQLSSIRIVCLRTVSEYGNERYYKTKLKNADSLMVHG